MATAPTAERDLGVRTRQGAFAAIRARGLGGAGALTVASSGLALVMNLATGVLLARALGPGGRGASTAVLTAPQMVGWLFLVGSSQAVSYFRAREPQRAAALLGTWLVLLIPLSLAAIAVGELLLPVLLGAQTSATLALGQLFMATTALVLLTETTLGFVLGSERFLLFNTLKVLAPACVAGAYVLGWATGRFSVAWAVWSFALVQVVVIAGTLAYLIRRDGIGWFDRDLARRSLWYGLKGHSTNISFLLNARLDLVILPAFVSATTVGLYSVATSVSWVVFVLAGSVAAIALPLAVREGGRGGPATIISATRMTFAIAVALAVVIGALAAPIVRVVYGADFLSCVTALRLLLPGSVLYAAALVLVSGLYAAGRPFTAAIAQASGMVITVVGLVLFLRRDGIVGAAWVSTVAYSTVFATALLSYRRAAGLTWSALARPARAAEVATPPSRPRRVTRRRTHEPPPVTVGRFCSIADGVEFHARRPIVIGSDVWIARGARVVGPASIGHGAVVGARAVVTGDVRPYAIVAGAPAREIRRRFSDDEVAALLELAWWEWPSERVRRHARLLTGTDVGALLAAVGPATVLSGGDADRLGWPGGR